MPELAIVIGANGAGKSTWRQNNRESLPQHFYDADSIAEGLGSYDNPALQREARQLVDRRIAQHLERHESFGFESTYSGGSRPDIVRRAHALGYDVRAVFIGTHEPELNIKRVAARVERRTGHRVPSEEIERRWHASRSNLVATAPLFSTIDLVDNSGTQAQHVARFSFSGPQPVGDLATAPPWAADLAAAIRGGGARGASTAEADNPYADLDPAALRKAWRESGRVIRLAGRDLAQMAADHGARPATAKRLTEAQHARETITAEATRRGIVLTPPRRRGPERGHGR